MSNDYPPMLCTRRRILLLGTAGVASATGGCLSYLRSESVGLSIGSSHPEELTIEIRISPEYGGDPLFHEVITVDGEQVRLERENVVTGRYGDDFYVVVRKPSTGETFDTYWSLTCIGNENVDDRLRILITEWGDIRIKSSRCK